MPPRGAGGRPVERLHARRSIFFLLPGGSLARRLAGRPKVFFWEGFPLFSVPARRRLWGRAAGAFFVVRLFFLGFCVARGGPPPSAGGRRSSTPPRRVFSPSFFLFFPLAWQDRARVELAVKARSSSLGCRPFFFPVRTRSSTPRRPVPPWRRHGCWSSNGRRRDPFFSGLGGTRKPVLQVDLMKEIASQARFPSFFSPLFGGVFPGQATRVAVLEEALRGEKAWTQGFQARCRSSFPPPALPLRPVRRTPSRSVGRSSASRLIRRSLKSIGFAFVPGLRGAAFEAWPWPRTPSPSFSPFFFRSIPRRSVSPGRPSTSASTWKKRSGPRPFFFWGGFFSAERALRSAERALRSAERAQCRAGT